MLTTATIARALRGDAGALELLPPEHRMAVARTAERLRCFPDLVVEQIAEQRPATVEEAERLIRIAVEEALIELPGEEGLPN